MARRKKAANPAGLQLRGKVWVESDGTPVLTDAAADLLEQIDACGSLNEAAKNLRFAYRRAWMLVDVVNTRWPRPLVTKVTGGHHGGGTQLTDFGRQVLRAYRDLQIQLEHLLGQADDPFGLKS